MFQFIFLNILITLRRNISDWSFKSLDLILIFCFQTPCFGYLQGVNVDWYFLYIFNFFYKYFPCLYYTIFVFSTRKYLYTLLYSNKLNKQTPLSLYISFEFLILFENRMNNKLHTRRKVTTWFVFLIFISKKVEEKKIQNKMTHFNETD